MRFKIPFLVAFLCAWGGRAAAQPNLLPQGSFEEPGVNTGWAEGFNIPNNQEFRIVSENGKRHLRIENRGAGRQLDYVHAYVNVRAQIASLTVSARLRATDLKTGREGWHTARIGVSYQRSATLDRDAGLLLVGPDADSDAAALRAYAEKGGKAFFLPRSQADGGLGVTLQAAAAGFAGSLSVPEWPEARGLSASDLRWRTHVDTAPWLVSAGADIGADGLLGRQRIGKGVAVFCQIDPDRFQADEKTYFRYTRWRSTRAVAQLLAKLGASFAVDSRIFHLVDAAAQNVNNQGWPMTAEPKPERIGTPGYYHPDYRPDFPMGDNPYRYYRW